MGTNTKTPSFSLQQLSFHFKRAPSFFEATSFTCTGTKIHFLRGKNGAGKSTLFRLMRGSISPGEQVQGTIAINNSSYNLSDTNHREQLRTLIRMVPQKFDTALADQFSFAENLQLAHLPAYPGLAGYARTVTIPSFIDRFEIDYNIPVSHLSGGQRQILAILMALQQSAPLLLLDEPTAALDEKNSAMIMDFLEELIESGVVSMILIVCHDTELVEAYGSGEYHEIAVQPDGTRTIVCKQLHHLSQH